MVMTKGEGLVKEITGKTTKGGSTYYAVKIGEHSMSAFNEEAEDVNNHPVGTYVEYTMETKDVDGRTYNNLRTISKKTAPTNTPRNNGENRDRSILRQVALKAAVEIAKSTNDKSPDAVLKLGERFEDWLNRPFEEQIR